MELKFEFTDSKVSPWSRFCLIKQLFREPNIEYILSNANLPKQVANRGYSPTQLVMIYWLSVCCDASCFEHLGITRHDEVLKDMLGWQKMHGHKSFRSYFNRFSQIANQYVFTNPDQWFFSNIKFDNYTLDFDSTVITRYAKQKAAAKGYNPTKPRRKSHHSLITFVSDCRMIKNCWNRPGNTSALNIFFRF